MDCPSLWCYKLSQHEYLAVTIPIQVDKDSCLPVVCTSCHALHSTLVVVVVVY